MKHRGLLAKVLYDQCRSAAQRATGEVEILHNMRWGNTNCWPRFVTEIREFILFAVSRDTALQRMYVTSRESEVHSMPFVSRETALHGFYKVSRGTMLYSLSSVSRETALPNAWGSPSLLLPRGLLLRFKPKWSNHSCSLRRTSGFT